MKLTRIIVAGTRTFNDYALLSAWLDVLKYEYGRIEIVSGGAPGADSLGEKWAGSHGCSVWRITADWATQGRAAGPIRNRKMASAGDVLLVFWDGVSRGTANMIQEAKQRSLPIHVQHFF